MEEGDIWGRRRMDNDLLCWDGKGKPPLLMENMGEEMLMMRKVL
jgi:hypothetical protein